MFHSTLSANRWQGTSYRRLVHQEFEGCLLVDVEFHASYKSVMLINAINCKIPELMFIESLDIYCL